VGFRVWGFVGVFGWVGVVWGGGVFVLFMVVVGCLLVCTGGHVFMWGWG